MTSLVVIDPTELRALVRESVREALAGAHDTLMTIADVPAPLRRSVVDALRRHEVPGQSRLGKRWTFTRSALEAWRATRATKAADAPANDPDAAARDAARRAMRGGR